MHFHILGKKNKKKLAITIGNFDGIHIGHQYILNKLNLIAEKKNMQSAVLSFYPHPKQILTNQNINYIYTLRQKITTLLSIVDNLILVKFNLNISKLSAIEFIEKLNTLNIAYIIIGKDFKFGYKRSSGAVDLKEICKNFNIEVEIIDLIQDSNSEKYSSSNIKKLLNNANFSTAKEFLGKNFSYINRVSKGKQIGRKLGFPTINLQVPQNFIIPSGIYAVYAYINNEKLHGVASLGYRPSIDDSLTPRLILEVHILNWNKKIYGQTAEIEFIQKIRDEKHFANLDELKLAIQEDIKLTKIILKKS